MSDKLKIISLDSLLNCDRIASGLNIIDPLRRVASCSIALSQRSCTAFRASEIQVLTAR